MKKLILTLGILSIFTLMGCDSSTPIEEPQNQIQTGDHNSQPVLCDDGNVCRIDMLE